MTVTIDEYGYFVCSRPSHEAGKPEGWCEDIVQLVNHPDSATMITLTALVQLSIPPLYAQIEFKQFHEGGMHPGHDRPVPVEMHVAWSPEGSSRHYDDYIGTYLTGDKLIDVYTQFKMFLFNKYAPEADMPYFSEDIKCADRRHSLKDDAILHGVLSENEKVSQLFAIMTEGKCVECIKRAKAEEIDLNRYVPDLNSGPQARSSNNGQGFNRYGNGRGRAPRPGSGVRNFGPTYGDPNSSPVTVMPEMQVHTTEVEVTPSHMQGNSVRFGILDEAAAFMNGSVGEVKFELGPVSSGPINFPGGTIEWSGPMSQDTLNILMGSPTAVLRDQASILRGIDPS